MHLVTGGSGFLGNLIVRRLVERGYSVRILDILDDPNRPSGVEFARADIRDRDAVARAMRGIEVVHHNVALVPLTKSGNNFWEVNVLGTRVAAEEAVRAGVKSFVHMSSSAAIGAPDKCPVTAETPMRPVEAYGRSKLAGEAEVKRIAADSKMSLTIIRPRTILGEGRLGIFQILFEWISEGRNVYVIGPGDHLYQFVHAHDLMDAYMVVLAHGRSGEFNVGTDRFGTLRETLEGLIAYARTTSKVKSLPVSLAVLGLGILDKLRLIPLAPFHYLVYQKAYYFDVSGLLALGWKPKYSNDEMFRESYEWYLSNRQEKGQFVSAATHRKPVKQGLLKVLKWLS